MTGFDLGTGEAPAEIHGWDICTGGNKAARTSWECL